jgi:hypothetical protein
VNFVFAHPGAALPREEMMMTIRCFLPVLLLAAATACPAHANELAPLLAQLSAAPPSAPMPAAMPEAITPKSASLTDISDVWWTATESGWGLQLVQNETTVFATVYLYAADGRPSHYTATLFYAGSHVWAGDLYEATGPWFGAPGFNPSQVARRRVGTMRFDLVSLSTATLRYDVDGINVAKTVSRLGFVNENYTGVYGGVINQTNAGCTPSYQNGTYTGQVTAFRITQTGAAITAQAAMAGGGSCTYTGTYEQHGKLGFVGGTYTCTSGEVGTISMLDMRVLPWGIALRFTASNNYCATVTGEVTATRIPG